jgi:aminomethyltransferase
MATIPPETIPRRLSPFYHKQSSSDAKFTQDRFGWIRAERFTDPEEEKRSAERRVGVGDISHLTKLSLKGTNVKQKISDLYKHGKEAVNGIVLTEGPGSFREVLCAVLCRDEAMLIMNPVMSDPVRKLLGVDGSKSFTLTDVTSVLAGVYIAGEKSKYALRKLTELNVNPEEFPNLAATYSPLRHVPSIVMRFDLEKVAGYQIYFERAYGEYMWDAIFGAGKEFNMIPIGSAAIELLGWSLG